jgi:hypothetical protein
MLVCLWEYIDLWFVALFPGWHHAVQYRACLLRKCINEIFSKQSMQIWETENSNLYEDIPLHPVKGSVLCALSAIGIIESVLLGKTVYSEYCVVLLKQHFIPFLQKNLLQFK